MRCRTHRVSRVTKRLEGDSPLREASGEEGVDCSEWGPPESNYRRRHESAGRIVDVGWRRDGLGTVALVIGAAFSPVRSGLSGFPTFTSDTEGKEDRSSG